MLGPCAVAIYLQIFNKRSPEALPELMSYSQADWEMLAANTTQAVAMASNTSTLPYIYTCLVALPHC